MLERRNGKEKLVGGLVDPVDPRNTKYESRLTCYLREELVGGAGRS
jgi:hypothetical protein